MKIKTRLLIYNILIVFISLFIIFASLYYLAININNTFYNINSITVDENAEKVKFILGSTNNLEVIEANFKIYQYDLYVYRNKELIYGEKNSVADEVINNYVKDKDILKIIFVNNRTGVMRVSGNTIFLALHQEEILTNNFFNLNTPFHNLLFKIIIVIIVIIEIVLILAVLISNKIFNKVMIPVNLLKDGAKRIKNGNYNEPIVYEVDDEFNSLIKNFNNMQSSLKEKTEKNKSYELAKKEMINGISHDIRTPLTVVKGNIKGILDGVAKTKIKREQYLQIAYNRILDIENLLNKLFDTFNYETGEIKLNLQKVKIKNFIKEYLQTNENVISKKIKVNLDLEDVTLLIDETQFRRVFDNLVNNSLKYVNKKVIVDIKVWKEDNLVKISYKDNGNGVKEENLTNIFHEFFKEDVSRNNDKRSTGMGLYIVKKIIEGHDGTIEARNYNGLYFEITLKGEKS